MAKKRTELQFLFDQLHQLYSQLNDAHRVLDVSKINPDASLKMLSDYQSLYTKELNKLQPTQKTSSLPKLEETKEQELTQHLQDLQTIRTLFTQFNKQTLVNTDISAKSAEELQAKLQNYTHLLEKLQHKNKSVNDYRLTKERISELQLHFSKIQLQEKITQAAKNCETILTPLLTTTLEVSSKNIDYLNELIKYEALIQRYQVAHSMSEIDRTKLQGKLVELNQSQLKTIIPQIQTLIAPKAKELTACTSAELTLQSTLLQEYVKLRKNLKHQVIEGQVTWPDLKACEAKNQEVIQCLQQKQQSIVQLETDTKLLSNFDPTKSNLQEAKACLQILKDYATRSEAMKDENITGRITSSKLVSLNSEIETFASEREKTLVQLQIFQTLVKQSEHSTLEEAKQRLKDLETYEELLKQIATESRHDLVIIPQERENRKKNLLAFIEEKTNLAQYLEVIQTANSMLKQPESIQLTEATQLLKTYEQLIDQQNVKQAIQACETETVNQLKEQIKKLHIQRCKTCLPQLLNLKIDDQLVLPDANTSLEHLKDYRESLHFIQAFNNEAEIKTLLGESYLTEDTCKNLEENINTHIKKLQNVNDGTPPKPTTHSWLSAQWLLEVLTSPEILAAETIVLAAGIIVLGISGFAPNLFVNDTAIKTFIAGSSAAAVGFISLTTSLSLTLFAPKKKENPEPIKVESNTVPSV